jgi:putative hydrolase of the HAD superfamily
MVPSEDCRLSRSLVYNAAMLARASHRVSAVAAITFDAGNTLLYCDPPPAVIYARHLSRYGRPVQAGEVEPVFRAAWEEMQRRTATGRDRYGSFPGGERAWWGAFVREVIRRLHHSAPWEPLLDDLWDAFLQPEVWQAYPETLDTVRKLGERGLRLAVISNWDRRLPEILAALDIDRLFDVLSVSSIEGVEKPSPEIFHRTLARLGVDARNAIHVGDSPHDDYRGAEDAGLTPILIDRDDMFSDQPYRRISSLDALLDMT